MVDQSTDKQLKTNMWDVFENILLFISMYVLAISIIFIFHQLIDRWVPNDISNPMYYPYNSQTTLMKIYLSALIVSFPFFAFFFLDLTKRTLQNPSLKRLPSRKMLIYITLIFTFLAMLGNIIGIVFNFLNGSVTTNFLMHFLATLAINGIIFSYYFAQVKEDRKLYV